MSVRNFRPTPELLLRAYEVGLFPMAESRTSRHLYWLDPDMRGILPLDRFHLPKRLRRTVLSGRFEVSADRDFRGVIAGCAAPQPRRQDTWINHEIETLFIRLHQLGYAHSIEVWEEGALVGGLYGVSLGGAFFGESMFSFARDASKVALVHLVVRLRRGGFSLLDTQFVTGHLAQFGAREIPRAEYKTRLAAALARPARWLAVLPETMLREELAQLSAAPSASEPEASA
jgi:leucyl/phenylalanyl-tRNA--protein transferase